MAELLRMPELAANTNEAVLASWSIPEGTPFSAGAVLATVETAKASVDVEAEADGVLVRTLVEAGSEVPVYYDSMLAKVAPKASLTLTVPHLIRLAIARARRPSWL